MTLVLSVGAFLLHMVCQSDQVTVTYIRDLVAKFALSLRKSRVILNNGLTYTIPSIYPFSRYVGRRDRFVLHLYL